jgi:hypothetical protein
MMSILARLWRRNVRRSPLPLKRVPLRVMPVAIFVAVTGILRLGIGSFAVVTALTALVALGFLRWGLALDRLVHRPGRDVVLSAPASHRDARGGLRAGRLTVLDDALRWRSSRGRDIENMRFVELVRLEVQQLPSLLPALSLRVVFSDKREHDFTVTGRFDQVVEVFSRTGVPVRSL